MAFEQYAVKASSVSNFLDTYYKKSRYTKRGEEYATSLLEYYEDNFKQDGFTFISKHDSSTGEVVSWFGVVSDFEDLGDREFNYMLLSRMVQDCEYYLGNSGRHEKHLWSLNVNKHIADMKALWFGFTKKPEWLSIQDILNYEKNMKEVN